MLLLRDVRLRVLLILKWFVERSIGWNHFPVESMGTVGNHKRLYRGAVLLPVSYLHNNQKG